MSIDLQQALQRTIEHREIFHDEMLALMRKIMSGEASPVMVAALTVGLRVKKETIGEIAAAAQVMREFSTKVEVPDHERLVDIVGTGGDASHTFNISTASMFVAAAAGARVAKHGGRSVSSRSGSADVLEALGANIMLKPEQVAACIGETGIGFMFAPNHHSAMKHAAPVRKELGIRTIFNILGPLTNPAGAPNQLLGVFHPDLVGIQVRVLQRLGSKHVLVVYGKDGMDEVSLGAATMVGELKDGEVREYEIHPEDFGLRMISNRGLKVADALESKTMLLEALDNAEGTPREIVVLNAGVALYAANAAATIPEGIERARAAFPSGTFREKLKRGHADVDCAFRSWSEPWLDPEFRTWDITEALGYIRVPILIVQGEQDQYGTLKQLEAAQQECFCPVETAVLPGIRHVPHREAPELTLNIVADFINRLLRDHHEGEPRADSGVVAL